jgi:phenylacetate-CoA ligase
LGSDEVHSHMKLADAKATLKGMVTCLIKRHLGPYRKLYEEIHETQWLSAEELEAYQLRQLKRIVRHAYGTVPYYRELMDRIGLRPEHLQHLSDVVRFPVMTKGDLKKIGDRIVSTRYGKLVLRTAYTGGTSGLPLPVRRDIWSISREHAFVRRQFDWAGLKTSDRCAYLEGRIVARPGEKTRRYHYYDAFMRELTLSTFHLTPDTVEEYVRLMRAYGVAALVAYPSAAYVLAKGCLDRKLVMPLRGVLTTSETLDEGKKQVISSAFACPVFDFYGSAERVCYIHMCERGSYHVIPEYGLTELHPAQPPNEDCCRIVSTGFWNLAMPLIRYEMGDLVRCSGRRCACGRHFPVVDKIMGRDGNLIMTPSGVQLGASAIEYILERILQSMYQLPVSAGRVLQEGADTLVLEYVPEKAFRPVHADQLRNVMREQTPQGMRMCLRAVNAMERTVRGKYLSFVMAEHH